MEKNFSSLFDSYKESTQRTRFIFSVLNVSSILLLISFFNYRLSWRNNLSEHLQQSRFVYECKDKYLDKAHDVKEWLGDKNIYFDSVKLNSAIAYIESKKRDGIQPEDTKSRSNDDFLLLAIPTIGVKIYVQDIPLLGGFAIAVLLTWYLFARRRESGIVKEIADRIKEIRSFRSGEKKKGDSTTTEQHDDLLPLVFYNVSFKAVFNSIKGLDFDLKGIPLSKYIIKILFYAPCLLLGLIQVCDTFENHIWGSYNQKYLEIETHNDPTYKYLRGDEIDYYVSNFNIDIEGLRRQGLKEHVSTWKYTDVMYFNPLYGNNNPFFDYKTWIKGSLILMQALAFLFIWYSYKLTKAIYRIIHEESVSKKAIEQIYDEMVESRTQG